MAATIHNVAGIRLEFATPVTLTARDRAAIFIPLSIKIVEVSRPSLDAGLVQRLHNLAKSFGAGIVLPAKITVKYPKSQLEARAHKLLTDAQSELRAGGFSDDAARVVIERDRVFAGHDHEVVTGATEMFQDRIMAGHYSADEVKDIGGILNTKRRLFGLDTVTFSLPGLGHQGGEDASGVKGEMPEESTEM